MHVALSILAVAANGMAAFGSYRYFLLNPEQVQARKRLGRVAFMAAVTSGFSLVVMTQLNPDRASFATGVFIGGVACVSAGALLGRHQRSRKAAATN